MSRKIERKIESHVWSDDFADITVDAGWSYSAIRFSIGWECDQNFSLNKRDVLAMLEHLEHMERFEIIFKMYKNLLELPKKED